MAKHQKQDKIIAWSSVATIVLITILIVGFIFPGSSESVGENSIEELDRRVTVKQYETGSIDTKIEITGRVVAMDQVELFSEVQGRFEGGTRPFRTGVRFKKGDILAQIDDTEERLSLIAQRSRFLTALSGVLSTLKLDYPEVYKTWAAYTAEFNPEDTMPDLPEVANRQAKLFLTSRGIYDQYYSIRSAESTLQKFTIVAPYNGELRSATLNPGSLVQPGVRIGEFTGSRFELESFISLANKPFIQNGDSVMLYSSAMDQSWKGTITRVGSAVDQNTQSIPVFIEIDDPDLRDGIYLQGTITGRTLENVVEIPRNLLTRNNTILIVEEGRATHQAVEPLLFKKESVIVSGLSSDDMVIELRAGANRLAGTRVIVEGE